jgi:hypothetical protein
MSNFHRHTRRLPKRLLLIGLLLSAPGWALAQPFLEGAAVERLRESMVYLSALEEFALDTQTSIEVVLLSGQKIQFDNGASVVVRRPDKMYAAKRGELVDQEFFYDGETLTLADGPTGYHATVEAPGTLEGMLDFARESLDIVAPAGDFIYANAFEILMQDVYSGFVVGTAAVGGTACDHLAFSAPGTDWQIWIQRGDKPLPRKIVITSRDVVNAPQFTVSIDEWNLSPDTSDDRFRFEPSESSQHIEFTRLDAGGQ